MRNGFLQTALLLFPVVVGASVLPPECANKLAQSWELLFSEDFAGARRLAIEVQQSAPGDPESYELVSTIIIAGLKKKLGIAFSDKVEDKSRLEAHTVEIELCKQQISTGIKAALEHLAPPEREGDARTRFLLARLHANRLWLNLQILGERRGHKDYLAANNILNGLVRRDPPAARVLVLSGWFNYTIANQPFYLRWPLKAAGISGDKQMAFALLDRAVAVAQNRRELMEARFSLLSVLLQEKRWQEAHRLASLLLREFPQNQRLRQQAEQAGKHLPHTQRLDAR